MSKQAMLNNLTKSLFTFGTFFCGFVFTTSIQAREHLYNAIENQDLLTCENLHWAGSAAAALDCYQSLTNPVYPAEIRAEAKWALGDIQGANSLFQIAANDSPDIPLIRIRWAELFNHTYQYQQAYDLFQEALAIEPNNAYAHIGAAFSLSQGGDNTESINQHMTAVLDGLSSPPGARLRAMIMLIHSTMEQNQYDKAYTKLTHAKNLASTHQLPKVELLAIEAALAFLTNQNYQPFIDAALKQNPTYGDAYAIAGYFASINRLYTEAGEFYQKAVDIQPKHWQAHLELGQNHLRLNNITAAAQHINTSYLGDPFNPKTINISRLLDTFQSDFQLFSYPEPQDNNKPSLALRLHASEHEVLNNYARQLSEDSIAIFSERYRFNPEELITVEIFPNHEDFVVRSIGMPGIGILGVTFGYLFAMDSPSAHPGENYHWGTTLWHEMAHVFTLGVSKNRVPRWYSEGISVYEEWNTGPTPGVKVPTTVLQAMAEGKFLSIAHLDDGFMRPTYDGQVIVSYMQAGLVFQFINLEYGHDKIVDILHAFSAGANPLTAIQETLDVTLNDFDQRFKQFIDIQYGPLLQQLPVWLSDQRTSINALNIGNWTEVITAAKKAIFTYPDYVEIDSPYLALAHAYDQLNQPELAFLNLEKFWKHGGYATSALMSLATIYSERQRYTDAIDVLQAVNYADPFNEQLHVQLGELFLQTKQPQAALDEFLVGLALDPIDQASANFRIAKAYNALNKSSQSLQYLMRTLDIAPQFRPAQMLLLSLSRKND